MCFCDTTRIDPPAADPLGQMVEDALADLTDQGAAFTAYEVTAALRKTYPGAVIPHRNGVREAVHAQMAGLVADGRYTCRLVRYYHGTAFQYKPTRRRARPAPTHPLGTCA